MINDIKLNNLVGNYILQNAQNARNVQNNIVPSWDAGEKLQKQINASSMRDTLHIFISLAS